MKHHTQENHMAEKVLQIGAIAANRFMVTVVGISPLQTHRFGETAQESLKQSTLGKSRKGKKPTRNPDLEYKESLYTFKENDTIGFPSIAFKKAMISACRVTSLTMATAKQMFFAWGSDLEYPDYCEIYGVDPELHESIVPTGSGKGSTLSWRGIFPVGWKADVVIEHLPEIVNEEELINLLNLAGFSVGIGPQRPENGGQYGRFEIVGK